MDTSIMMNLGSMAYSDQVVFQALQLLIAEHGCDARISQTMIADKSGASLRTVQRAVPRLIQSGKVIGEFSPQIGYSYRLPDAHSTSPTGS